MISFFFFIPKKLLISLIKFFRFYLFWRIKINFWKNGTWAKVTGQRGEWAFWDCPQCTQKFKTVQDNTKQSEEKLDNKFDRWKAEENKEKAKKINRVHERRWEIGELREIVIIETESWIRKRELVEFDRMGLKCK